MTALAQFICDNSVTSGEAFGKLQALHDLAVARVFKAKEEIDQKYQAFIESLPRDFLDQFNEGNTEEEFTQASEEISKIETLVIYFASEFDAGRLQQIGAKVRELFGPNHLLEVKIDPALLGGCALVWRGVYKDYSLRARLSQEQEEIASFVREEIKEKN